MGRAVPALLDELRGLGFSEGQNLTMDYRSTNKSVAQFALDLADMVRAARRHCLQRSRTSVAGGDAGERTDPNRVLGQQLRSD